MGRIAAGGGCVARWPDGRVAFVRHALPGERVVAEVTSEARSYVRADALEVREPSPDRVEPPCRRSGPGRCGGCDFQHVAPAAQRRLKADLIAEQLLRLAGIDGAINVESVPLDGNSEYSETGLAWRTRVRFAVDRGGRAGLHRHRSKDLEYVEQCPIAVDAVNELGVTKERWVGAHHLEVASSGEGGPPVIAVDSGRRTLVDPPVLPAGIVANGRTVAGPTRTRYPVRGHVFDVSAGVFWQVHPRAAGLLGDVVLDWLAPRKGDRVADLYAGAGLFSVLLAAAVGTDGHVVAIERSGRACADLDDNAAAFDQVDIVRADVTPEVISQVLAATDLVVLDPARTGAGIRVMEALAGLDPPPRRIVYVSCDAASFARDLRAMLDRGWTLDKFRAFDLFPMTEHTETVALLLPPNDGSPDRRI